MIIQSYNNRAMLSIEVGTWHVNSLGPQSAPVQDEKDIIVRKRLRD